MRSLAVVAVYAIPLGIAAGLVLSHLAHAPFWRDEVATVSIAGRSIRGIGEVIAKRESNGSLYYLLMHPWIAVFGHGEGAVRLPSAIFGLAGIAAAIRLSLSRWGVRAAVATGAVLASSTFLLYYAGEARGYALASALAVVATVLFMRAVETGERRAWLFWALAAAALVYTQVLAALLIGAQLASLVFLGREERPRSLVYGLAWLGGLVAPLAVVVASSADKGQTDWASKLKVVQLQDFGVALAGARPLRVVFALIVATAVGLLVRELARNGRSPAAWRLAVPVCWTVLPVLALALISVAKGMFVDRYLLFIVPGFAVLAGAVVAEAPRVAGRVLLATLVIGCTALAIVHPPWERKRSEDLRAAAAFVAAGAQPGDGIAYAPAFARVGFGFYLDKQRRQPRDLDVGESATDRGDLFAGEAPAPVVAQRLMAAKRVWIVGYPRFPWHPTPEPVMEVAPQILRERFKPAGRAQFGEIVVALYRRAG